MRATSNPIHGVIILALVFSRRDAEIAGKTSKWLFTPRIYYFLVFLSVLCGLARVSFFLSQRPQGTPLGNYCSLTDSVSWLFSTFFASWREKTPFGTYLFIQSVEVLEQHGAKAFTPVGDVVIEYAADFAFA